MSTYFHHPKDTETPTIKRDSHDFNPGYAVINFGDLSCFPSDVQVLQLRDALDEYIDKWLTAREVTAATWGPSGNFMVPEPEVCRCGHSAKKHGFYRERCISCICSRYEQSVPQDRFIAPEPDEITAKYRGAE